VRAPVQRLGGVTVVFATHGVSPVVRTEAADWRLVVIDGGCLLVTKGAC
jgi:4-hydroxy-3-methylbut-2-enyl diphosphate reductase IspH